ncbi:hypothetical protein F6X40_10195 [Paraburkholderia sp. UCT31]|uniref:DUF6998 domain-containing protein n=1 Tax=Paraburkholderia sp. UCT31 TaxID=2615209 RepID=UPI00165645E6|nr:hypothetical protein [Paraburkholderia sp. UCT31]MBC8737178.1 hypothetical protein [Paraburkholderia sp. UCT31]
MSHASIRTALAKIFQGIRELRLAFPNRSFTIDGLLVGHIGEVIAALEYDLQIDDTSREKHDGVCSDGRLVQVKATFQNSLTFGSVPDYYLGFQLREDGTFEEIYNGPGAPIFERYSHRKGIGEDLLSFPVSVLRGLSAKIPDDQRIPRRPATPVSEAA